MSRNSIRSLGIVCLSVYFLGLNACFGARTVRRNYWVLHTHSVKNALAENMGGVIRVRDLDAESVYDKFQIVVRQNPYQLCYSGVNLWAVRPNIMVADLIGRRLQEEKLFRSVTRDLSNTRPDFNLAGELRALEVYDSGKGWFAHLSLSLRINRFTDGEPIWQFTYEQQKPVEKTDMHHAVQMMSELLQQALNDAVKDLLSAAQQKFLETKKLSQSNSFWHDKSPNGDGDCSASGRSDNGLKERLGVDNAFCPRNARCT